MTNKKIRKKWIGTWSMISLFLLNGNVVQAQDQLRFSADGHIGVYDNDVYTIRYSADGKYMVTACQDNTAKVWDAASGKMLYNLSTDDEVKFATFSPDGKKVATASLDKSVIVWDRETGEKLMKVTESSPAEFVFFSPDSKRMVTQPSRNHPEVWDIETRKLLFILKGHTKMIMELAYSPDGKSIATTSMDETAIIWDARTGDRLHTITGSDVPERYARFTNTTSSPCFSPDGKELAFSSGKLIQICDVGSGKILLQLKGDEYFNSVAFSPDGRTIVTSDKDVKVWNAKNGKLMRSLQAERPRAAVISPDGKTISGYSYKSVTLWDAASGRQLHQFSADGAFYINNFSLAFSPDGAAVAVAMQDGAHLWETDTGKKIRSLGSKERKIMAAYSADGKAIIISSGGRSKAFEAAGDKPLFNLKGDLYAFSPDGKTMVTISDKTAYLYDAATGKLRHTLTGHSDKINLAVFGPHNKILITTGGETDKIWDIASGTLIKDLPLISGLETETLAFSPNGENIITATDGKFAAIVRNVKTLESLFAFQGDYDVDMRTGSFTPDGKSIITISGIHGQVIKWDAKTGNRIGILNAPVGGDGISEVAYSGAFSPDGKKLVVGFREDYDSRRPDESVNKVFNINTAEQLFTLEGESDDAHFSPNGKFLFGYMNKTAMIWDASTGKILHSLNGHDYNIYSIACSPDNKCILTTAINGSLIVWDASTGKKLLQQFIYDDFERATTDGSGSFDATAGARSKVYGVKNSVITGYDQLKEHEAPGLWSKIMAKE